MIHTENILSQRDLITDR